MWEGQKYTLQGQKMPQHLSRSFFLFTGKEAETQKSSDFFFSKKPFKKQTNQKPLFQCTQLESETHISPRFTSFQYSCLTNGQDEVGPCQKSFLSCQYWNTNKAIVEKLLPKFHVQPERKKIRALKKTKTIFISQADTERAQQPSCYFVFGKMPHATTNFTGWL